MLYIQIGLFFMRIMLYYYSINLAFKFIKTKTVCLQVGF